MKKILRLTIILLWLSFITYTLQGQTLQGEWLKVNGGDYTVSTPIVHVDKDGRIFQAGYYSGASLTLGGTTLSGNIYGSAYVAVLGTDGNLVWVKQFGTDSYTYLNEFHLDPDGTSRIYGNFYGTYLSIDGDTLHVPGGISLSYYYLILDPDGNVQHFSFLGEPLANTDFYIYDVSWNSQGDMVVTGINYYDGDTLAFGDIGVIPDPNENSVFVACFNAGGTPLWADCSLSTQGEYITLNEPKVSLDVNGETVLLANYEGLGKVPVFGTDTLSSLTSGNIFFVKFNNSGNFLWSTQSEGASFPWTSVLETDNQRNILTSGVITYDTLKLASLAFTSENNLDNNFIIKLDPDGTLLWGKMIDTESYFSVGKKKSKGQSPSGSPNMVYLDDSDNISLITWFENDTLFLGTDTLVNDLGGNQLIVKYSADGTYIWSVNVPSSSFGLPTSTMNEKSLIYLSSTVNVSFDLDSASIFTDGTSVPAYILGIDNSGTVVYGNVIETSSYNYVSPYTIDDDNHSHLIVTGSFGGDIQINNVSAVPIYNDNLFMGRLAYLTRMSGVVSDASASPVDSGYVYLYKLMPSGQAPLVDSVKIAQDGSYEFKDFTYHDYLVYAFADTLKYTDAMGTYYGDEIAWELADTVHAITDTIGSVDISITELTVPLDGDGTIGGTIEYSSSKKSTTSITGEPVKKVKVILIGMEKSTQNVIAWVYTNDQGQYYFENIPDGSYSIYVDIPGLPMDSTYNISVSGNVISGLDFLVTDTEVVMNNTSVVEQPITEVTDIHIWPNPSSGIIELSFTQDKIEKITVFDSRGSVVKQLDLQGNLQQMKLDLTDQPAGMYYIRIKGEHSQGVSSVIIQH